MSLLARNPTRKQPLALSRYAVVFNLSLQKLDALRAEERKSFSLGLGLPSREVDNRRFLVEVDIPYPDLDSFAKSGPGAHQEAHQSFLFGVAVDESASDFWSRQIPVVSHRDGVNFSNSLFQVVFVDWKLEEAIELDDLMRVAGDGGSRVSPLLHVENHRVD